MDHEGQVYDLFGAAKDIAEGRVRFVNDPLLSTLRRPETILGFFRHYAWFGKGKPDALVAACIANSELLAYVPPRITGRE